MLLKAAHHGNLSQLAESLKKARSHEDSDPNMAADNGVTPLMLACRALHIEAVQMLVREGVDVRLRSRSGVTALAMAVEAAASSGCRDVALDLVQLLLHADFAEAPDDGEDADGSRRDSRSGPPQLRRSSTAGSLLSGRGSVSENGSGEPQISSRSRTSSENGAASSSRLGSRRLAFDVRMRSWSGNAGTPPLASRSSNGGPLQSSSAGRPLVLVLRRVLTRLDLPPSPSPKASFRPRRPSSPPRRRPPKTAPMAELRL